MVSLFCHCCVEKPITSLLVHRIFSCRFDVHPLTYRFYEKKNPNNLQLKGDFDAFQYNPSLQRENDLFKTSFYMADYSDTYWEQANVPLHMYFPDDEDDDTFYYKLGADFLTPFGKEKMVELPTTSDMSSYLVSDLFFDNPASDYFYFFVSITFQIPAAPQAPINVPTMKIQRCSKADPPAKSAGAILRAGFTEVPV